MRANFDRLRAATRALVAARAATVAARQRRDAEIAALAAQGVPQSGIAAEAAVTKAAVRKALRRALSGQQEGVQSDD